MKKLITIIILFFACISIYGQNDFILLSRDYPIIDVVINGKVTTMLIDTGADVNIIDTDFARKSGCNVIPTLNYNVGAGSNLSVHDVNNVNCTVKGRNINGFITADLQEALLPIELKTKYKIAGILGTPAIKELKMVIDLSRGIVTINKNSATTVSTD